MSEDVSPTMGKRAEKLRNVPFPSKMQPLRYVLGQKDDFLFTTEISRIKKKF